VGRDPADTRAAVRPTLIHTEINERLHAARSSDLASRERVRLNTAPAKTISNRQSGPVVRLRTWTALTSSVARVGQDRIRRDLQVTSAEDAAGWPGFFHDLTAEDSPASDCSPATRTAAWSRPSAWPWPGPADRDHPPTHHVANPVGATPKAS